MKFTKDMIETTETHFQFPRNRWVHYWRHVVKLDDGDKLCVDFVRKVNVRGWRMNIRRISRRTSTWNNGWPTVFKWMTSARWIRPDGIVELIDDKKNNDHQQDGSKLEDGSEYVRIIWEALQ